VLALWADARSAIARTADTEESVAALLDWDPGALLVAIEDGAVVGALVASWDGFRGNMYRLAVAPAWRRRGVANELVDAGHARLRSRGARRVTALVGRDEQAAIALWRSAGYELDELVGRFVRDL
jgi:ribosomal protein S18 acetylase RimI-like enzyme